MQNARENAGTREGPGILRPAMVEKKGEKEEGSREKSNNPNPVGWGTKPKNHKKSKSTKLKVFLFPTLPDWGC